MILIRPPKLILLNEARAPVQSIVQALGDGLRTYEWPFTAAVESTILVNSREVRVYATLIELGLLPHFVGVVRQTVTLKAGIGHPNDWVPFIDELVRLVVDRFSQFSVSDSPTTPCARCTRSF
jgi:hypothetical protein